MFHKATLMILMCRRSASEFAPKGNNVAVDEAYIPESLCAPVSKSAGLFCACNQAIAIDATHEAGRTA